MVASILYTIVGAIIGGLVTFYFTRKKFEKEIKENPPINGHYRSVGIELERSR